MVRGVCIGEAPCNRRHEDSGLAGAVSLGASRCRSSCLIAFIFSANNVGEPQFPFCKIRVRVISQGYQDLKGFKKSHIQYQPDSFNEASTMHCDRATEKATLTEVID